MALKVIGYTRVSTGEQGESGLGLKAQERAIREECRRRGWELVELIREVQSAKDMKRPKLRAAIARLDLSEADALVAAKLDRLSRSVRDCATLLDRALANGWQVRILDADVDTSTPTGEAIANVIATFAQLERRLIGQRTREALAIKRAQGVRLGRPRSVPPKTRARIAQLRRKGWSYGEIAAQLDSERIPTGHGAKRWQRSSVQHIAATERTAA